MKRILLTALIMLLVSSNVQAKESFKMPGLIHNRDFLKIDVHSAAPGVEIDGVIYKATSSNDFSSLIPLELKGDYGLWDCYEFVYEDGFREYETIVKGNLDDDPEEEVVISFCARTKDDMQIATHFCQVYDPIIGSENKIVYRLAKTICGNMYPGSIELSDLNGDGKNAIIMFSHGGMHGTDIYAYQYQEGDYQKIFDEVSACPIEFEVQQNTAFIKVGRENWEQENWCYASENNLWEVYRWNGAEFAYDETKSTTPLLGFTEAMSRTMEEYVKRNKE